MGSALAQIAELRQRIDQQRAALAGQQAALAALDAAEPSPALEMKRNQARMGIQSALDHARNFERELRALESRLDERTFLAERIRFTLLPNLIQVSPAYRVPGGNHDPEESLYRALLSADPGQRDAMLRLERLLSRVKLFGESASAISLRPVNNAYGERVIHLSHPTHGELPIRNLGSGEQQMVYMLAQRVITPFPIAQVEEPEAHLHTLRMESLAKALLEAVRGDGGTPDVDQLWIATHHHHFALAPEYFDVSLVDGATVVERKPRAKAAEHFYEPGPIWEALRQLAMRNPA